MCVCECEMRENVENTVNAQCCTNSASNYVSNNIWLGKIFNLKKRVKYNGNKSRHDDLCPISN